MKKDLFIQLDFDVEKVLNKPLMAHLATNCKEGPRSSPLWFLYEEKKLWLFGTEQDSFINRLHNDPNCALSIVDFDLAKGILLHVGVRGKATQQKINSEKLHRFVGKYLGYDTDQWNKWFVDNIVKPLNVMVEIECESIVAKDVSFFKTGPHLASEN